VSDERDEIDAWLQREVTPLYPAAGSFERISRRARVRKRRQVTLAAVSCAVLIAVIAIAPHLSSVLSSGPGKKPPSIALGHTSPPTQPVSSPTPTGGSSVEGRGHQIQTPQLHTTLTDTWTVPPRHFQPTSVTVVGYGAKFLGAVIGQAGIPGECATQYCTSLAGTADYGKSWKGVSAPVAPGADQPTGVSQLRFGNTVDGWAFGPGLWETSDGGWPWHPVTTDGLRVTDLEAYGPQAFAIAARCTGDTADFASHCTSFSLYTLTATSKSWTPVPVPAAFRQMTTTQPSSASLVIAGSTTAVTVYVLTPSGAVLGGPVGSGTWTVAGQAPSGCLPGPAQVNGQPSDAQLAVGQNQDGQNQLLLACDAGTQTALYSSANGATWTKVGPVVHQGVATSLTTSIAGQPVLATTAGLLYSPNGGTTWQPANALPTQPPGGFAYVGMTNQFKGVAVPEDANLDEIYVTNDGGQTWTASPIKG
jgi:hypothetical protein